MKPLSTKLSAAAAALLLAAHPASAACPLAAVPDAQLAQVLRGHGVRTAGAPKAILFRSKMARDDDGAPTAYHRGNADDSPDPGLDHICNGGDVLEFRNGSLTNKYAAGGSVGRLDGIDPATGVRRSRLCKRDYIAVREAHFPTCGPSRLCMRFYGVAVEPRSCGFNKANEMGCGVPIRQRDASGNRLQFYLTRNILMRPNAPNDSHQQSDYADASRIPFIVMPGGLALPGEMRWQAGDLAVVAAGGRTAYAVIGDSGPRTKLGEGSRALLQALGIAPTDDDSAVTTLLFPETASQVTGPWPLDPATFKAKARALLGALPGGAAALRECPGMSALE